MKKLKRKGGFTLVECIIAMAVLAIMSLLLTMILSVALRIRNENIRLEQDLDKQVDDLANGAAAEDPADKIDEIEIDGISIPANKVYAQVGGIGKVNSDLDDYFDKLGTPKPIEDNSNPGANPDSLKWEKTKPCFGHIDLIDAGSVNIYYNESDNLTKSGDTYTVEWRVKFDVKEYSQEDSVKITLPTKASFIDWSTARSVDGKYDHNFNKRTVRKITESIIMIRPYDAESKNIDVYIYFTIPKENYENDFKNLQYYFSEGKVNGTSSPYSVEKGNFQ